MDNITEFKKSLKALMLKHKVDLHVDIEGDTHGISTDFCVSESDGSKLVVLAECQVYLQACDIEV